MFGRPIILLYIENTNLQMWLNKGSLDVEIEAARMDTQQQK